MAAKKLEVLQRISKHIDIFQDLLIVFGVGPFHK